MAAFQKVIDRRLSLSKIWQKTTVPNFNNESKLNANHDVINFEVNNLWTWTINVHLDIDITNFDLKWLLSSVEKYDIVKYCFIIFHV